jgi:hypothetical protein
MEISGNDIGQVAGTSSSCCQACQQTSNCVSSTWNSTNGGTCWLKNDTQPLSTSSGAFTTILAPDANHKFTLSVSYTAPNFFDQWIYETVDYNHGFVEYVDQDIAQDLGLISIRNDGKVKINLIF